MDRREMLKLAPAGVLALILRPRVQAEPQQMRRSKPFIDGLERGSLSRADIRELEEADGDHIDEAYMAATLESFGFGGMT